MPEALHVFSLRIGGGSLSHVAIYASPRPLAVLRSVLLFSSFPLPIRSATHWFRLPSEPASCVSKAPSLPVFGSHIPHISISS